jgi:ribosomal protein S18 acetylase RimI-like enzyme
VQELLTHLEDHYPDFTGWLDQQFRSTEVVIKLAIANSETTAGVSISKQKELGVWKLGTFYIDPKYQRNGLGQHLLFHEMQTWLDNGVNKVIVTTGVDNSNVIDFFTQIGFVVEGIAPERYPGQVEIVLARHFVPRTFTPAAFPELAEVLARRLLAARVVSSSPSEARCQSLLHDLPLYMATAPSEIVIRCLTPTSQQFFVEIEVDGLIRKRLDALDLETQLHPLTLTWPGREAFIIPIYEQYAEALFEMHRPQLPLFQEPVTKRLLQMDNVYYCYPRYTEVIGRGTPILFYVTKDPDSGAGVAGNIVGMALTQEVQVASSDVLYIEHGQRGVYDIQAIESHTNSQGQAMAIHFSWLRPFPSLLPYRTIKKKLPQWNAQTLQAINHSSFLELCQLGGLHLGDAVLT